MDRVCSVASPTSINTPKISHKAAAHPSFLYTMQVLSILNRYNARDLHGANSIKYKNVYVIRMDSFDQGGIGSRYWILDARCSMLDPGYLMLDPRCWIRK